MNDKKKLYQAYAFDFFLGSSYFIYFLGLFGIVYIQPSYLSTFDFLVKICVSVFLIYRFNHFRKDFLCNHLDKIVVFNAGVFLLTTIVSDLIAKNYVAQQYVNKKKEEAILNAKKLKNKVGQTIQL
jgi:hypothetical protein